jgi:hypothetical protein
VFKQYLWSKERDNDKPKTTQRGGLLMHKFSSQETYAQT